MVFISWLTFLCFICNLPTKVPSYVSENLTVAWKKVHLIIVMCDNNFYTMLCRSLSWRYYHLEVKIFRLTWWTGYWYTCAVNSKQQRSDICLRILVLMNFSHSFLTNQKHHSVRKSRNMPIYRYKRVTKLATQAIYKKWMLNRIP